MYTRIIHVLQLYNNTTKTHRCGKKFVHVRLRERHRAAAAPPAVSCKLLCRCRHVTCRLCATAASRAAATGDRCDRDAKAQNVWDRKGSLQPQQWVGNHRLCVQRVKRCSCAAAPSGDDALLDVSFTIVWQTFCVSVVCGRHGPIPGNSCRTCSIFL